MMLALATISLILAEAAGPESSQHPRNSVMSELPLFLTGAGNLPPVTVSQDGRFATIAAGTSPVPIGLYAMVYATYPDAHGEQFFQMTQEDYNQIVSNGYIAAVSLSFTWADIQPNPPPAPLDFTNLTRALDMIDIACEVASKAKGCMPVFLKPYLIVEPEWTTPFPYGNTGPVVRRTPLNMSVVLRPTAPNGTDLWDRFVGTAQAIARRGIPISTDSAWQAQITRLTTGLGTWLNQADSDAMRVRVIHFVGPVMSSLQMRPGPEELFPSLDNSGKDTLGMNWSKRKHIDAWKAAAQEFARSSSAFAKRPWVFDFTVLPPSSSNASKLFLDTADQLEAFNAVANAHPAGPGAVIAKTESLHVDLGAGCNTCSFTPDPEHSSRSFAVMYQDPANKPAIPYSFIGERAGRHGWENFAALSMKSLPFNKSQIPSMFPVNVLAKFSIFQDMNASSPVKPQQTLWAEIWRNEGVNTSLEPSCESPLELENHLRAWDSALRSNFQKVPFVGGYQ